MSVTTKTGDDGKSRWSRLHQGSGVPKWEKIEVDKDCDLLEAVGSLDELQAMLGVVKLKNIMIGAPLTDIQKDLWQMMGVLAYEKEWNEVGDRIEWLEKEIKEMEESLPKISEFVLPGVSEVEAELNLARTICRRAERRLVALSKETGSGKVDNSLLIYINRMSDYLFILGRVIL